MSTPNKVCQKKRNQVPKGWVYGKPFCQTPDSGLSYKDGNTQDTIRTDTEEYDREGPVWSNSAAEVIDVAGRVRELLVSSPHLCLIQRPFCVAVSEKTVAEIVRRRSNIVSGKFFGVG